MLALVMRTATSPSASSTAHRAAEPARGTLWGVTYSVACYVAFLGVFGYFIAFLNNVWVPKSIDSGEPSGLGFALAANFGLVFLWALQHSVMARPRFKAMWTRIIPPHTERATYVLASAAALQLTMSCWTPVAGTIWTVQTAWLELAIYGVAALAWGVLLAASFEIDHFALFGVKQPVFAFLGRRIPTATFKRGYLYRIVRHPIQTGVLFGMWATPNMTTSHFMFAGLMTLYIFVGLFFEERELIREFGNTYREYKRQVAKLIPFVRLG